MIQENYFRDNEKIKDNNIINEIKEFQNNYYSIHKKNFFFKKKQKLDCANNICDHFSLDDLISKTIYIIPDTNIVFLDYTLFKLFANPDNYEFLVNNIILLFQNRIDNFNNFELHVNLDNFTISSLERYKSIINTFINKCLSNNTTYIFSMNNIHIYNVPKSFDTIITALKSVIHKDVYKKLILCDEKTSKEKIEYFYNIRDNIN